MHSLEAEYLELHAAGVTDEPATLRAVALERGEIFSVFEEVRLVLYAAVAAITAGVGILLQQNLDRIGPITLMAVLALVAAACYATAIRTRIRRETRSTGSDYLLLLGALIASADVGYAESQFHWLGSQWSWYLLILAALHATAAYTLESRLVLSVAITSLAAWIGVDAHVASLFQLNSPVRNSGLEAIICGALILGWREIHRRLGGVASFHDVLDHFAANFGFWGALALCHDPHTRFAAVAVLCIFAVASIINGLRTDREAFVIYGVAYEACGLCYVEAQLSPDLLVAVLELATVIAAVILLWQLRQRMKATAP
jgi:hypothetical protein